MKDVIIHLQIASTNDITIIQRQLVLALALHGNGCSEKQIVLCELNKYIKFPLIELRLLSNECNNLLTLWI